jgi:hypothetical protein
VQLDTYAMQGLLDHNVRPLERKLMPARGSVQKFQAFFAYDVFQKTWMLKNLNVKELNDSF